MTAGGSRKFVLALAALLLLPATSHVEKKPDDPLAKDLFVSRTTASPQKPQVYGFYSKGCVAGAEQLAETGPTWQAMRLSRNRNWGHPDLIAFVKRLSVEATKIGWPGIYVGDMSQPRGGPMFTGHASHQNGLDVDIWLKRPTTLKLSRQQRETISSDIMRSNDQKSVTASWTPSHMALLKAAAEDKAVDRIFVAAAIKIWMCNHAGKDRKWLAKIRPLYGHYAHFHVRLSCPKGNRSCQKQRPTVRQISKGDGCDETLTWWVTDYLNPPPPDPKKTKKKKTSTKPPPRSAREMILADLPKQCVGVLTAE